MGAGLTLSLSPRWNVPEEWLPALCEFVARCPAGRGHRLWVTARDPHLTTASIVDAVSEACAWAAGDDEFAEVELTEEPAPAEAIAVGGAEDVRAALGLGPSRPAPDDDALARAEEGAALFKRVLAILDAAHAAAARSMPRSPRPLVSVPIPTWKGHRLLLDRAIPSILNGGYPDVEVVVASDGPDPAAREAVEGLADPRVRYFELDRRPAYPQLPYSFWSVAGSHAANLALSECRGEWIAPLDHDDSFTEDHIELLLRAAYDSDSDMVYAQGACEMRTGAWRIIGSTPLRCGAITHGSVLFAAPLARVRFDATCWLDREPGDWNVWRRMGEAGARISFLDRVVLIHYKERSSIEQREDVPAAELEAGMTFDPVAAARDAETSDAAFIARLARRSGAALGARGA
jgi:hypothetical protein